MKNKIMIFLMIMSFQTSYPAMAQEIQSKDFVGNRICNNDDLLTKKRAHCNLSDTENDNTQKDVSGLSNSAQLLKIFDSQVMSHGKSLSSDTILDVDKAMQDNLALRQKEFEKKVYVFCLYKVLEAYRISLADFNTLDRSLRQALLLNAARNNSEILYSLLYPEGIKAELIQPGNVLSSQQKNKKRLDVKFDNDLYPQTIKKVLDQNNMSIDEFNELSTFRKTTLMLDANLQDSLDLQESEQRAINVLMDRRDKSYESVKKSKNNRLVRTQTERNGFTSKPTS